MRKDSSEIAEANVQLHVAALGVRLRRVVYAWKVRSLTHTPNPNPNPNPNAEP